MSVESDSPFLRKPVRHSCAYQIFRPIKYILAIVLIPVKIVLILVLTLLLYLICRIALLCACCCCRADIDDVQANNIQFEPQEAWADKKTTEKHEGKDTKKEMKNSHAATPNTFYPPHTPSEIVSVCLFFAAIYARLVLIVLGVFWITVKGNPPKDDRTPGVIVANHTGFVDGLIILAKHGCSAVAKVGVASLPMVGVVFRACGCIFVNRADPNSRNRVKHQIWHRAWNAQEGSRKYPPLLLFPEGTSTNGRFVIQFSKGGFEHGSNVLPIGVSFPYRNWNPCWSEWSALRYVLTFLAQWVVPAEIVFLPPYMPNADEKQDFILYSANVQAAIATSIGAVSLPLVSRKDSPHLKHLNKKAKVETAAKNADLTAADPACQKTDDTAAAEQKQLV